MTTHLAPSSNIPLSQGKLPPESIPPQALRQRRYTLSEYESWSFISLREEPVRQDFIATVTTALKAGLGGRESPSSAYKKFSQGSLWGLGSRECLVRGLSEHVKSVSFEPIPDKMSTRPVFPESPGPTFKLRRPHSSQGERAATPLPDEERGPQAAQTPNSSNRYGAFECRKWAFMELSQEAGQAFTAFVDATLSPSQKRSESPSSVYKSFCASSPVTLSQKEKGTLPKGSAFASQEAAALHDAVSQLDLSQLLKSPAGD